MCSTSDTLLWFAVIMSDLSFIIHAKITASYGLNSRNVSVDESEPFDHYRNSVKLPHRCLWGGGRGVEGAVLITYCTEHSGAYHAANMPVVQWIPARPLTCAPPFCSCPPKDVAGLEKPVQDSCRCIRVYAAPAHDITSEWYRRHICCSHREYSMYNVAPPPSSPVSRL